MLNSTLHSLDLNCACVRTVALFLSLLSSNNALSVQYGVPYGFSHVITYKNKTDYPSPSQYFNKRAIGYVKVDII